MKNINKKIVGYSNEISVRPKQKISFMVSCDKKIKSIYSNFVKIIQGDNNPEGPGYKDEKVNSYKTKKHKAINQNIYSGSYIYIPLKNEIKLNDQITFITFIKPTLNNKKQQSIFSIGSNNNKKLEFYINKNYFLEIKINKKKIINF